MRLHTATVRKEVLVTLRCLVDKVATRLACRQNDKHALVIIPATDCYMTDITAT